MNTSTQASTRAAAAGAILLLGAAVIVAMGLTRRYLPEVVLAIGATLVVAWVAERRRRFIGSGCVLLGLGIGLALAEHIGRGAYRDQLIFAGIAGGLLATRALGVATTLPAALALLSVAFFEFALQYLPTVLQADRVYRAFDDGWAFGVLIALQGCIVVLRAKSWLHRSTSELDRADSLAGSG